MSDELFNASIQNRWFVPDVCHFGSPYFFSSSVIFIYFFFRLPSRFFRSLDDEHLVPAASDVEAVGRHGYTMILSALPILQKRQIGSRSCRVTAFHFESNIFSLSSIEVS